MITEEAPPRPRIRLAAWSIGLALCLANILVGALSLEGERFAETLSPAAMMPDLGHNVIATPAKRIALPFVIPWDTEPAPEASSSSLFEDGKRLGPAHSQHADIRSRGEGRFSFWSGNVYFSASDNSDPRTNGRSYTVLYGARLTHAITFPLIALDALAAAVALKLLSRLAWFRKLVSLPLRRPRSVATLFAATFAVRVVAAALGWMDPLFAGDGVALGRPMMLSIIVHLLLGVGGTVLVGAMGAGLLIWWGGRRQALDDIVLRAFLPGALAAALAAVSALVIPQGSIVAAGICLAAAAPIATSRPDAAAVRQLLLPPILCAPFVLLFGAILSFMFHGPTATLAGTPIGDTTIYVGQAETLTQHIWPFFNYAVEGFKLTYANVLPSLLASPLLRCRWFDPYLFFSATLPVLAMLTLATILPASVRVADPAGLRRHPSLLDGLVIGLLLFGMLRSASMMIGSPPFVFLFPVVVASIYLSLIAARPWGALVVGSIGTAVSKVVGFITIVPLPLPHFAGLTTQRQRWAILICGAILLLYVVFSTLTYLPGYIKEGIAGPTSWFYYTHYHPRPGFPWLYLVFRDAGTVLLALAVTRSSFAGLKLGVWLSVISYLLLPFLFYSALTAAMLAVATAYSARPTAFERARWMMLMAGVMLLLPQTFGFEADNAAVTLSWAALVACITVATVASGSRSGMRLTFSIGSAFSGLAAVCLIVLLWGGATGAVDAGADAHLFTPDMRDIWRAVRERTPPNGLIFTDQTDATSSRTGGWNDYALAARRQFYVVSWEVTPLRQDEVLRRLWLDRNAAVLAGTTRWSSLSLSRRYEGAYAVTNIRSPAPPQALLLYANSSFGLYRLPDD